MPERPFGIVLTAIYSGVSAVFGVVVGLLGFVGAGIVSPTAAGWVALLSFAALALGVVSAAAAYGLWSRQPWAPKVTLALNAAGIVMGVLAILYDRSTGNVLLQVIGIVISCVIIAYIRKPEVEALFRDQP
jgi:uncharacterized membrane protein (DUF2068 family)